MMFTNSALRERRKLWQARLLSSVIALSTLLTACGPSIAGKYQDSQGITSYEFKNDGQVYMNVMGTTVALKYTTDGDKVLLESPQGTLVMTRKDKGLEGPGGMMLNPVHE